MKKVYLPKKLKNLKVVKILTSMRFNKGTKYPQKHQPNKTPRDYHV